MSSLNINPPVANIDISDNATYWLWACFSVLALSAFGLLALGTTRPTGQRAFHHLAAAICFTASVAYYCMASDLGAAAIPVEFIRGGSLGQNWVQAGVRNPTRSIWYARYIDWTITTPLLLLELLFATGLPLSEVFVTIFADIVMIICGLIGSLVASRYKWGLFAFGCAAQFFIWYVLLGPARASAYRLGTAYQKEYMTSAVILSALWLLYPIAWGVADGGNVITPTSEMIFYGVLDLLAKPVFCFYHCFSIHKLDYARFGLSSGKYSEVRTADEKYWNNTAVGTLSSHLSATPDEPRASTATAVDHNNVGGSGRKPVAGQVA
ncbi:hypothetical protein OIO90_003675 [Microbotryomycetes sp. JL221]|nr:hypothetical protein OIO90_003675 [Microbotryomycetes sp. JL221]